MQVLGLILRECIRCLFEQRDHLRVFDLVNGVLSDFCNLFLRCYENNVEALKEPDEAQDSVRYLNRRNNRLILGFQEVQIVTLEGLLVEASDVFADDVGQLVVLCLGVPLLENLDGVLLAHGLVGADQDEKAFGLADRDLPQVERPWEKVDFCVHLLSLFMIKIFITKLIRNYNY